MTTPSPHELAKEAVEDKRELDALPKIDEGIGPVTNEQRIAVQYARAVRSDWRQSSEAFRAAATPEAWLSLSSRVENARREALEEAAKVAGNYYRQWSCAGGFESHTAAARIIRDAIRNLISGDKP